MFRSYDFYDSLLYLGFVYIGYTQFYSLLRRGFTIRLLIDIHLSKQNITKKELSSIYSGGRGLGWFLQKRLSGLEKFKLLNVKDNKVQLTSKFQIIFSRILLIVNKVLGIKLSG